MATVRRRLLRYYKDDCAAGPTLGLVSFRQKSHDCSKRFGRDCNRDHQQRQSF
jgi:hypothetical protein